jgi:hypothetical protein
MKEEAVPVPPHSPCTESDSGVLPVLVVSHFGEAQRGVDETPGELSGFTEHFFRSVHSLLW